MDISVFEESPSCDHLYFSKQVMFPGEYKLADITARCHYSLPARLSGSSWDQKAEKLARSSLMFSDSVSRSNPNQGVKVLRRGGSWQNLWAGSDLHRLTLPWTLQSGFHTGFTNEWIKIRFGDNPWRTAVIWGMQFMKEQVELQGTVEPQVGYKYSGDVLNGVYTNWRKPFGTEDGMVKFTVTPSDLDENGLYYFKQPAPDQDKSLVFIASEFQLKFGVGMLNFDFLGTFYDFNAAKTGVKSGKADDWNDKKIGNFWIKGSL